MSAANIIGRLDKARRTGPASWSARCPAHEDRSPSLAVRETDDGRVLLHCFGGCSVDSIVGALGLELADLFPPKPAPGGGAAPERRRWRAHDLIHLAAFESSIVRIVASEIDRGCTPTAADMDRLTVACSRLQDVARAIDA